MRNCSSLVLLLFLVVSARMDTHAQAKDSVEKVPNDWFLLDPETDHFQGVSAERTYSSLLVGKPARTVVVAVVDSGVDPEHEDLKSVMWTNDDEIPGNGIDDDKNGYVDDVHGWNFIGGKNGNVEYDTYELTREFMRLRKEFEGVTENKIPKKKRADFEKFKKVQDKYQKLKDKNQAEYDLYKNLYVNSTKSIDTLKTLLQASQLTPESVKGFKTADPSLLFAKGFVLNIFNNLPPNIGLENFVAQLKEGEDYFGVIVNYGYNENYDSRKIVGDNYSNLDERYYGNNDVKGPDALHGTHVAGIIAADRTNNLGIKGIADHVRIMSVRTVPNGDERDKDVANAIRYAVDNGANIINMSFGKYFSPNKEVVDKAIQYAEQKGVLLVHAAGNESKNNDTETHFPTRIYNNGKSARNWVEVGASSWGEGDNFIGDFSNYGKKSVDFFAPGVQIYSTTPGNTYKFEDGTSMACPAAAGVAAILMSYFPELSAIQVKEILNKSTRRFDNLKVPKPGSKSTVEFSDLSVTGGLVNAYDAVKLAMEMKRQATIK